MKEIILSGKNLSKRYPMKNAKQNSDKWLKAVDGVDLDLRRGSTIGIVGESGSGKSTLAKVLIRLETADRGSLQYEDTELLSLTEKEFRGYRKNIQMVFQNPFGCLDPRRTIYDSLSEVLKEHKLAKNREQCMEILKDRLQECSLDESVLRKKPGEFSGGQLQRIAVVRALLTDPEILIADEITSALDVSVQGQLLEMLQSLQYERNLSIIFISHNLSVIKNICDFVYVMKQGKFVESGETEKIFLSPEHSYTKELMNAVIPFPSK